MYISKAEQAAKEAADKTLLQTILSEAKEAPKAAPPLPPPPAFAGSSNGNDGAAAASSTETGSMDPSVGGTVAPSAAVEALAAAAAPAASSSALQAAVGLAELWTPPVAKETYDQATNTDGPMLPLDDAAAAAEAELRPAGAGGSLSPARPAPSLFSPGSATARGTPARAGGAAGNAPSFLPPSRGDDRAVTGGGTVCGAGVLLAARLSGEAAAAVLEDEAFRSFVETKSRVVS